MASSREEEPVAVPPCRLEIELVCSICLKLFQEPHILGCSHSFCLACLKGCIPEGREEGSCPECRSPFRLRQLIYNRSLGKLAEEIRSPRGDQAVAARRHVCPEHDEPLKLFCSQDEEPICVICRELPRHRGHEFVPTKNAVEGSQVKLKPYLKTLNRELNIVLDCESFQERQMEMLEYCAEGSLRYISRKFEVLRQTLNAKEQEIIKTLQNIKKKNREKMEDTFKSLKNEISLLSDRAEKIKAALATTDHVGFLKDFKSLMEKIQACQVDGVKHDSKSENETIDEAEDSSETEEESEPEEEESESEEEESESEEEELESEEEEEEEEEEGEEDDYYSARVVFVEEDLKKFKRMLNFKAWKEMLECIKYRHPVEKDKERCPTEVEGRVDGYGLQFKHQSLQKFIQTSKLEAEGVSQTTVVGNETDLYTLFPTSNRPQILKTALL